MVELSIGSSMRSWTAWRLNSPLLDSACLILTLALPLPTQADLLSYVAKPELAFEWRAVSNDTRSEGSMYDLRLVSQVWRGITWSHELQLFVPRPLGVHDTMLLFITGGAAGGAASDYARAIANELRAPVAVLYEIPNQPLLDGKFEDDLIAETFLRFLASGEDDWPLLLPMTKSAVKAMDALQEFARRELGLAIDGFVLSGASKRGWTTWLAAAADPRVKGIVPRVIDMLNIPAQLPHQLASWGSYSEMLRPYTDPGLPTYVGTEGGRRLVALVDPFAYRERLTMPKLIVLGTNDRYWALDALNLYWSALPGSKHVLYVPNAGHALPVEGWKDTLACFFHSVASQTALPQIDWRVEPESGELGISVTTSTAPQAARLWTVSSPTRDFREARWSATALPAAREVRGKAKVSREEYVAAYLEITFSIGNYACSLSTQIAIEPPSR